MPNHPDFKEGRDYIIGEWSGYKNYQCTKCQYDSLWFVKMAKHLANNKHKWAFPRPEGAPPPVDKNGDPPY